MILLIDTTKERMGKTSLDKLEDITKCQMNYEYIKASELNISHCLGCNFCWLKTPGECAVKDDYEPILKKISVADQVWLITDTKFGFVSYENEVLALTKMSEAAFKSDKEFGGSDGGPTSFEMQVRGRNPHG